MTKAVKTKTKPDATSAKGSSNKSASNNGSSNKESSSNEPKALDWLDILQKTEMRALASINNEITQLISNTDTSATKLASMILKDAALTSQVLKIANSVVFNPDQKQALAKNKDSELRRAIVRIGFNGIRCICISIALIDSIVKNPEKQQRLLKCLAQSFHTAVHARNVAQEMAGSRAEDVFIAGLLQNLGELVFWCSPISEMAAFKKALKECDDKPSDAAKLLTNMSFEDMSKSLSEVWSLSETLSDSFNPAKFTQEVKAINLGKMMSLGVESGWESKQLKQALNKITKDFNIDINRGMALLKKGADEAVAMANEYGPGLGDSIQVVEKASDLTPVEKIELVDDIVNSDSGKVIIDNAKATTASGVSEDVPEKVAVSKPKNKIQEQLDQKNKEGVDADKPKKPARQPNPAKQMQLLDELWEIAEGPKPVAKTSKLLADGLQDAVGLERVIVFTKVNKKEEIKLNAFSGKDIKHLEKDAVLEINDANDSIFRYCMRSNEPLWIAPDKTTGVDKLMTKQVKEVIGKQKNFFLAPVKNGLRVSAIVYADMAGEDIDLADDHFTAFSRFIKQASRALSNS